MKAIPILFSNKDLQSDYPTGAAFSSFVFRAMKEGRIKQVRKGLYALVNPSSGNVFANKFQIASRAYSDAFLSYHEALEYYGLANQSFVSTCVYLTDSHARDFEFDGVLFQAKKPSIRASVLDRMTEEGIRVASLERAIVDSIDRIPLAGGMEELENALGICPKLDEKEILSLLSLFGKAILYQKVGYLFEKHFGNRYSSSFYGECLSHRGKCDFYLDCHPGNGKRVGKWRLMVEPTEVLPNEIF